jgi:hypothetical protein
LAFASCKGAPGVSTTTVGLAAAWPRPVVLVEADPSGGSLAARFSLPYEPGVVSLAATARRSLTVADLETGAQPLLGHATVLPAPAGGGAATAAVTALAEPLSSALQTTREVDVLLDFGRLSATSPTWPLAEVADRVVVCTGAMLAEIQHLPAAAATLTDRGVGTGLVVVGDGPWPLEEVAAFAGIDLVVTGRVAHDPVAAGSVGVGGVGERALRRSRWWRSIAALARSLADDATAPAADPESSRVTQ